MRWHRRGAATPQTARRRRNPEGGRHFAGARLRSMKTNSQPSETGAERKLPDATAASVIQQPAGAALAPVADVETIRKRFPALDRRAERRSGGLLRRARRHAGAARGRRADGRLPLPAQREHPLALSDLGGDRRGDRGGEGCPGRLSRRRRVRDRLRPEHDDADVSPLPRAGASWGPGDEIVVTELDHHANVDPWKALAVERGITVRTVTLIPETGHLDWSDLERAVNRRTKLVAIGAASNALGTVNDVTARPGWLAQSALCRSWTPCTTRRTSSSTCAESAATSWPARRTSSTARTWASCGAAASSSTRSTFRSSNPRPTGLRNGSRPARCPTKASSAPRPPSTFWPRSRAAACRAGARRSPPPSPSCTNAAAVSSGGCGRASRRSARCSSTVLPRTPRARRRSPSRSTACASADAAQALARRGLYLSSGDFYAWTVVQRLGHASDGLIRAGCACYTTDEEVDRLVEGVRAIAG